MCICTYLNENDCMADTTCAELNDLLRDVRNATGEDWRIRETIYVKRRWFRSPVSTYRYELLKGVGKTAFLGWEFQIINFFRPDRDDDWSINTANEASHVAAFLYGIMSGVQAMKDNRERTRVEAGSNG